MKFSYNWLKEYVDIKETPEQLAEILTMRAFEAEGVERLGKKFDNVIVGEVLGVKKHPNADRLNVTTVNTGKGVLEIVCGAPNVATGQKVAVALSGAKLPNGIEIIEREVRGVKSQGMICAEDELGLSTNHEGIMVLPAETPVGTPFSKFLDLEDAIIDFSILPDRAHDALSYWGMSQEISAVLGKKLKAGVYDSAKFDFTEEKSLNVKNELSVEVTDKDLCRRYSARVVKNVSVSESPDWLKKKLESAGIRPINNLVDISNLVMLEAGQPLHIFDLDKIESAASAEYPTAKKIIVRRAKKGEEIETLDGTKRKLTPDILIIADIKKPLAIAGIMGGEESAVTAQTKNIIIESVSFEPANIRVSSKNLGLSSDSSYRFEREIDRNLTVQALNRTAELVGKTSGGQIAKGVIDIYPSKTKPRKIKLQISDVEKLLGAKIADKKIAKILVGLGFIVKRGKKDVVEITVPTRRLDITGPVEIIREIARLYGYDNIKPVKPRVALDLPRANFNVIYQNKCKKFLAARGFAEVYNYSFIGDKELENIGTGNEHYLELANPLNPEHKYLRLSLVPSLLTNIASNSRVLAEDAMRIFEIGKVYYRNYMGNNACLVEKNVDTSKPGVGEKFMLTGSLYSKTKQNLFYEAKNEINALLEMLKIKNASYVADTDGCPHLPVWHLGRYALIAVDQNIIGVVGEINSRVLGNLRIQGRVSVFNIDFQKLLKVSRGQKLTYRPVGKFPPVKIDLAILVPKKVLWADIASLIYVEGEGLVKGVELFDIYEGKNIPTDKKSLAFHIVYQSEEKTLKDDDIRNITNKITGGLKDKFGANLRK